MRLPTQKRRPRRAQMASFPSPTGGWVANRNLAMARGGDLPPGAAVLENWFPTAMGVKLRRGSRRWASLMDDTPVKSLFTYVSGNQQQFFAATSRAIYNITSVASPDNWALATDDEDYISSDPALERVFGEASVTNDMAVLTGLTNGDWVTVQYTTAGGTFLLGVNGSDPAWIYDGVSFQDASITFPSGSSMTTSRFSYIWVYKNRVWFIEKDSTNAWYLAVDQIGGPVKIWPMGGVFMRGGALLWGQTWSLDTGGAGGLSGQCVFATTEGEVAAYQGLSPDPDQGWSHVGTYRIGRPMGRKGIIRAGGDLIIATTVGFISLAQAARSDYAALGRGAISYPIEDAWAQAVTERGEKDWRCQVWADGQMVIVAPPTPESLPPVLFVSNSNSGGWCKFTGWDVSAMEVFQWQLFFGSPDGSINQGNVTGADNGQPYVGRVMPLFEDLGAPGSVKIARHARAIMRAVYSAREKVTAKFNFDQSFPPPPDQPVSENASLWNVGNWEEAIWNADSASVVEGRWVSVGGSGHDVSLALQITSGNISPLDVELVRLDLTFETADIVT